MQHRDEVYVVDMGRILFREWLWFVAGLLVVLVAVFAFSHTARRQWEATAYVQIGQVGATPPGQDPKVEPLLRVIERLQTVPFQNQVMASLGIAADAPDARLYRRSLKLEPMPYAGPLVKLSVRGWSPTQATQFAEATVTQLGQLHHALLAAPLSMAHARLDDVQADLKRAEDERAALVQAPAPQARVPELASVALATTNDEIRNLKQVQSDLTTRLAANFTYDTSLMWPVYVPQGQAFPNTALVWGIGVLLGLSLGAFAAIVRHAIRRARG